MLPQHSSIAGLVYYRIHCITDCRWPLSTLKAYQINFLNNVNIRIHLGSFKTVRPHSYLSRAVNDINFRTLFHLNHFGISLKSSILSSSRDGRTLIRWNGTELKCSTGCKRSGRRPFWIWTQNTTISLSLNMTTFTHWGPTLLWAIHNYFIVLAYYSIHSSTCHQKTSLLIIN